MRIEQAVMVGQMIVTRAVTFEAGNIADVATAKAFLQWIEQRTPDDKTPPQPRLEA